MKQRSLLSSFAAIMLVGCSLTPTAPDLSDPAKYVFTTDVAYRCNAWQPAIPTVGFGLFDVFFADPGSEPSQAKIQAIVAAGGTVVHRFKLNGVRVIASPAAVSQLNADEIVGVRQVGTYTVQVGVGLTAQTDAQLFTSLGGTVTWAATAAPFSLIGSISDAALPALRASAQVRYVEWSGPVCSLSRM